MIFWPYDLETLSPNHKREEVVPPCDLELVTDGHLA